MAEHGEGSDTVWRIGSGCVLVKGAVPGAIYDLNMKRVFSLNRAAIEVVDGSAENEHFWEELASLGLAERSRPDAHASNLLSARQPTLEFLWLELLSQCNLSCAHCYASSSPSADTGRRGLTQDRWLDLIEQASKLGCRSIQLTGGEPLLYTNVFELASFARERGLHDIELFTNGTLLTQRHIGLMKELDMSVAVSLHSSDPKIHDGMTRVSGSHSKTLDALRMLRKAEIPTRACITVVKHNQGTVAQTRELLRRLGLETAQVDVVRPVGRGTDAALLPDPSLAAQWRRATDACFSIDPQHFERNRHWNPCWTGKAVITESGDVLPCVFARDLVVGNVQESSLEAILPQGKLWNLWKINKDAIDVCKACEFRYACTDCRVLAMAETGNILAKSPRCSYDPLSGAWTD